MLRRGAVEREAVRDCLEGLGAGASADGSSFTPSPSVSSDSASVGSSDGPLAALAPPSDALVGVACRNEGRLANPGVPADTLP